MPLTKNRLNAAALLLDNVSSIKVSFNDQNPKLYTYLCTFAVGVGDSVVVETPWGLKTVTVEDVQDDLPLEILDAEYEYKFAVQRVNTEQHELLKEGLQRIRDEIARKEKKDRLKEAKKALGLTKGSRLADAVATMRARLNEK